MRTKEKFTQLRQLLDLLDPGANPLKDTHAALDAAVLAAYGFSAKKDLLAQLLALNRAVAANIEKGEPVTAPGVPKNYPDSKKLVTEDYISMTAITVIKGTIKFADIKPQGGDQRRAFEEMCFQLRGEKMRQGLGQGMAGRAASFQRRLGAQQFSVRPLKNLFVGGSPPHPF